jgi:ATP-dependent Zn protease
VWPFGHHQQEESMDMKIKRSHTRKREKRPAASAATQTTPPPITGPRLGSVTRKELRRLLRSVRFFRNTLHRQAESKRISEQAVAAAHAALKAAGQPIDRALLERQLTGLVSASIDDFPPGAAKDEPEFEVPAPGCIAARLLLTQLLDNTPGLADQVSSASPVVALQVRDQGAFSRIIGFWAEVLLPKDYSVIRGMTIVEAGHQDRAVIAFVRDAELKPAQIGATLTQIQIAVQSTMPIIAIAPQIEKYFPAELAEIATHILSLPPLDAQTIAWTIRIVTGQRGRHVLSQDIVARLTFDDLALHIRHDRSAEECVALLIDAAQAREEARKPRELALDELHGLDEAVAWARSTLKDLESFREGRLPWHEVDHGVVLEGPPGTGKTLFAGVFAAEAGLPLLHCTLARWQGTDEGHLGHLLRAMRRDFDHARSIAPCVMFIDEIDAFANRDTVEHKYRDFVVEVVNAFLELLDGIDGREGIIFIGATNSATRCDPAILRAGRFNRIIRIGLPSSVDLQKMFRMRLRGALATEDLADLADLAEGFTGADVERAVKDARRRARQEGRPVSLADLRFAVVGEVNEFSGEIRWRTAVHEAGHAIAMTLLSGPDSVRAVIRQRGTQKGSTLRQADELSDRRDLMRLLVELLAGRAAEEAVFGHPGPGCGGVAGSDLAQATRIASAMIGSLGLGGPHPLVYLGSLDETREILMHPYLRAAVQSDLETTYRMALDMIQRRAPALVAVARELAQNGHIDGMAVADILRASSRADKVAPDETWRDLIVVKPESEMDRIAPVGADDCGCPISPPSPRTRRRAARHRSPRRHN